MNIEADFEQLDIGEEPIFERNLIKNTSMNITDKMSHLQFCLPSKNPPSMLEVSPSKNSDRRPLRAKSSVQTFDRKKVTGAADEEQNSNAQDF